MPGARKWLGVVLCAQALALAGCLGGGSSSGGGGNGSDDPNGGDPNGGNGNGGVTTGQPNVVFSDVAALSYPGRYSGDSGWAQISPVYGYDVDPSEQNQRVMVDTLMLGHTLITAFHAVDQAVLQEGLGRSADFYDFFGFEPCAAAGDISIGFGTGAMDAFCVVAEEGAGRQVELTGSLEWTDDPDLDGASREITFQDVQVRVEINGNWISFEVNGAIANREPAATDLEGTVFVALDAHDPVGERVFRFYRRWGVDFRAFDDLAFHPDHGALAMPGDGLYTNGGVCSGGGRSEASTVALDGPSVNEATAQLWINKRSCGHYFIDSSAGSTDSDGDFMRPELYNRFVSLFSTSPYTEFFVTSEGANHHEMGRDQSDAFGAEQAAVARLGRTVDGATDWTVYQLALDFDLSGFALNSGDVGEVLLRLALGPDGVDEDFAVTGFTFVVDTEWSGNPDATHFVNPFNVNGAISFSRGTEDGQSWAIADVTEFVTDAIDDGRTRLQLVIYATMAEPSDPSSAQTLLAWYCLDEESGCDAVRLPKLSVAGAAPLL